MIFTFDSILLQVVTTCKLLRWEWQGPIIYAGFQRAFEQLVLSTRQYGVTSWLADMAHMPPIGTDEQAWLSEVWLMHVASLRLRRIALIMPLHLHNQLVLESVLADGRRYMLADVQFFSDTIAALDWLTSSEKLAIQLEQVWQQQRPLQPMRLLGGPFM